MAQAAALVGGTLIMGALGGINESKTKGLLPQNMYGNGAPPAGIVNPNAEAQNQTSLVQQTGKGQNRKNEASMTYNKQLQMYSSIFLISISFSAFAMMFMMILMIL